MSELPDPGSLATEDGRLRLLQSVVELTRAVFAAKASSIMRYDEAAHELVFEAVAGEGAETLVGTRIAAGTGIAGWALAAEEPMSVGDVGHDPRFARDFAEDTGFVPTGLTVYPLLTEDRSLGVLSVLDQSVSEQVGLADFDLLARFARHAAAVLALVEAARDREAGTGQAGLTAALERSLHAAPPDRRDAALTLLTALERLLSQR